MRSPRFLATAAGTAIGWASLAFAQTTFNEVEPNEDKGIANAFTIAPGDMVVGNTTGAVITPPGAGNTCDYFRLKTTAAAPGIYRQRLILTTDGNPGHIGLLRGLGQSTGTIGGEVGIQTSSTVTTPQRMIQWYGFGKEEEVYYRVNGQGATTGDYVATYTREAVTAQDLGSFPAGQITIATLGFNGGGDSDLWVYDDHFDPIPGYGNDNALRPNTTNSSELVREYGAGVYYLAISAGNIANDLPSPEDDRNRNGGVMDFPAVLANGTTTTGINITFGITAGGSTAVTGATKSAPFEINWYKFTVTGAIPTGACCLLDNIPMCNIVSEYACSQTGGVFKGAGTACASVQCEKFVETIYPTTFITSNNLGAFLNLTSTSSVLVNRIDYYPTNSAGATIQLNIYTRDGGYHGFEGDAGAWTHHATIDAQSAGGGSGGASAFPTEVPLPVPILVQQGRTKAVYVHGAAGAMYYRSSAVPAVHSNGEFSMYSDRLRRDLFGGGLITARGFAGALFYVSANTAVTGACCLRDATCQTLSLAACTAQDGTFKGEGASCASVTCEPAAACCLPTGACQFLYEQECTVQGGLWSSGLACASVSCAQPGACCFFDRSCVLLQAPQCVAGGGTFHGAGTTCASGSCWEVPVLWSNGPLATGEFNSGGAGAPPGTQFSELQAGNTLVGYTVYPSASTVLSTYTLADDFTISAPGGWQIDHVTVYGYRNVATAGATYTQAALRIWDGPPGVPGSAVIFGDLTTNRLMDSTFANLYRNPNGGFALNAMIYANRLAVGTTLPPGHYWLEYNLLIAESSGINFSPAVTILNTRGPVGGNGRQSVDGNWTPILEHVVTPLVMQELPFIINGQVLGGGGCYANCDASTAAPVLNVADFTCFLQKFAAAEAYANCDASTNVPVLNVADFTCFLQKFAAGCP